VLSQVKQPVIIHWLGEMFDPALEGYWGNHDHMEAMETALAVIHAHADKVDGVKISLLDDRKEIAIACGVEGLAKDRRGRGLAERFMSIAFWTQGRCSIPRASADP